MRLRPSPLSPLSPLVLPLILLASAGCLIHNVSPTERLRDAVVGLNDEARWSRFDLATQRVTLAHREAYVRAHHDWGRNIQIGDVELLDVTLADDNDSAVSVVAVSWYRYDTMTLRRSVLRQEWTSSGSGFALASETVVEGDEALLAAPEPEEADPAEEPAETLTASASTSS